MKDTVNEITISDIWSDAYVKVWDNVEGICDIEAYYNRFGIRCEIPMIDDTIDIDICSDDSQFVSVLDNYLNWSFHMYDKIWDVRGHVNAKYTLDMRKTSRFAKYAILNMINYHKSYFVEYDMCFEDVINSIIDSTSYFPHVRIVFGLNYHDSEVLISICRRRL